MNPARVTSVRAGSIADEIGLKPGDEIKSINGEPVRDIIDYRFLEAEEVLQLAILSDGEEQVVSIEKDIDEDLGIDFAEAVFDGIKRCKNRCFFCFVDQMPENLRRSLYLKDDDYRYSFLFGNYITLTNLSEQDWQRIVSQHLSPLYVSIHTTNPSLRKEILKNPKSAGIMEQLRRLADSGINFHAQIVLCPGVNDGPELDRTIHDLSELSPHLLSIAIVPVAFRSGSDGYHGYDKDGAAKVVDQVDKWQKKLRAAHARSLVYIADEFYILAQRPLPSRARYDGFPQREDGIGLLRLFEDDWQRTAAKLPSSFNKPLHVLLTSGVLMAQSIRQKVERLRTIKNLTADFVALENSLFGPGVTVSGLVPGKDFLEVVKNNLDADIIFIPRSSLNSEGSLFIDNLRISDLQSAANNTLIKPVSKMSEVVAAVKRTGSPN